DLTEAVAILRGRPPRPPAAPADAPAEAGAGDRRLEDLRGQVHARWAAIVAAAGRHPLLLQGPPGTGKSMLARRVADLLPPLEPDRAMELARIEALVGPLAGLPSRPPLRAPHCSCSVQALLGGGHPLRPGELSRAHGGVLFLDELPEFPRPALEGLRQPLEERCVRLLRAREEAVFPADALLVAARNPCPCGFLGHPRIPCRCTTAALGRYAQRVSGPLLDRFDLFVEMGPVPAAELDGPPTPPGRAEADAALERARAVQAERSRRGSFAEAGRAELDPILAEGIEPAARRLLQRAGEELRLSGRGHLRCLRVARTLADLDGGGPVALHHLRRALTYRRPPPVPVA
ncbi:MAG: ATP-binding protein, partial [Planctomycetota bacterium]